MVSRKTLAYGLTANVVVLGFVSLFTDVSSEMILPILPFFLIQVLSANALIVGFVEGVAESVGTFTKIFSGRLSDSAGKRKRFVAAGYGLSTAMKVLFPFAQSWPEFLGMRILERKGKGVRDAPRDALLTESTPPETRGQAFGFHRSMDTAGAIAGPIITLVLLATVAAGLSREGGYRLILLLAAIPALVSVLVILFVREPSRTPTGTNRCASPSEGSRGPCWSSWESRASSPSPTFPMSSCSFGREASSTRQKRSCSMCCTTWSMRPTHSRRASSRIVSAGSPSS